MKPNFKYDVNCANANCKISWFFLPSSSLLRLLDAWSLESGDNASIIKLTFVSIMFQYCVSSVRFYVLSTHMSNVKCLSLQNINIVTWSHVKSLVLTHVIKVIVFMDKARLRFSFSYNFAHKLRLVGHRVVVSALQVEEIQCMVLSWEAFIYLSVYFLMYLYQSASVTRIVFVGRTGLKFNIGVVY